MRLSDSRPIFLKHLLQLTPPFSHACACLIWALCYSRTFYTSCILSSSYPPFWFAPYVTPAPITPITLCAPFCLSPHASLLYGVPQFNSRPILLQRLIQRIRMSPFTLLCAFWPTLYINLEACYASSFPSFWCTPFWLTPNITPATATPEGSLLSCALFWLMAHGDDPFYLAFTNFIRAMYHSTDCYASCLSSVAHTFMTRALLQCLVHLTHPFTLMCAFLSSILRILLRSRNYCKPHGSLLSLAQLSDLHLMLLQRLLHLTCPFSYVRGLCTKSSNCPSTKQSFSRLRCFRKLDAPQGGSIGFLHVHARASVMFV